MPTNPDSPKHEHGLPESLGVLLVNLGTPDAPTPAAVRRYLREFLWDPRVVAVPRPLWWLILHGFILRFRPARSARAYAKIWTESGSPLLLHSQALAQSVSQQLAVRLSGAVNVELAMSYGEPSIQAALDRLLGRLGPVSLVALLATLVLLFGFQGEQILAQPMVIALLAVPILIQVYLNAGLAYLLNRIAGEQHCVAGPSALIGASNFFELAVAAAISLFGFNSGAALATVVGVLIEVPVMLTVVWIVNQSKGWYERGDRVQSVRAVE